MSAGHLESPDKLSAAGLTFAECSSTAGANCTMAGQPKNINTVAVAAETTEEGTESARLIFAPKTKTVLTTLKFEGEKCPLAGMDAVSGRVTVSLPTGQTEKAAQEVVANTSSGEIKVGTASATLKSKDFFRISAGTNWFFGLCGGGLETAALPGESVSFDVENSNCTKSIKVTAGEVTPPGGPFNFIGKAECINGTKTYEPRGNTKCEITVEAKATAKAGEVAAFKVESTETGEKIETKLKVL